MRVGSKGSEGGTGKAAAYHWPIRSQCFNSLNSQGSALLPVPMACVILQAVNSRLQVIREEKR